MLSISPHGCSAAIAALVTAGASLGCATGARSSQNSSVRHALVACVPLVRPVPSDSIPSFFADARYEDRFVAISRHVPGGFTSLEEWSADRLFIQLVDTTRADTVRAALTAGLAQSTTSATERKQIAKPCRRRAACGPLQFGPTPRLAQLSDGQAGCGGDGGRDHHHRGGGRLPPRTRHRVRSL